MKRWIPYLFPLSTIGLFTYAVVSKNYGIAVVGISVEALIGAFVGALKK